MAAATESKSEVKPLVVSHREIRFETAQSWNKGNGNLDHKGKGNGGVNYPLPPRNPRKNP